MLSNAPENIRKLVQLLVPQNELSYLSYKSGLIRVAVSETWLKSCWSVNCNTSKFSSTFDRKSTKYILTSILEQLRVWAWLSKIGLTMTALKAEECH